MRPANGLVLGADVPVTAPSVVGALRFFLSTRSAFVDGQLLAVDSSAGSLPASWDRPLEGRVAVVTGAARGIGESIADTLARDGATVVAVDVPAAGEQLVAVANRVRGTALQLDVTAPDAGARILEHTLQRHGRIDIVVHNAGHHARQAAGQHDAREVGLRARGEHRRRSCAINEALLTSGDFTDAPRIVSLASTSGIAGNRGQSNYAASKGGVIGMVRATAPLLEAVRRHRQRGRARVHRDRDDRPHPRRHAAGGPPAELAAAGRPAGRRGRDGRVPGLAGRGWHRGARAAGVRAEHGGPVTVVVLPGVPGLGGLYAARRGLVGTARGRRRLDRAPTDAARGRVRRARRPGATRST